MLRHTHIEEKISQIFDNQYRKDDKNFVESHITACQSCRNFRKNIEKLSQILRKWMDDTIPKDLERSLNSLPKTQKEAITLLEYHKLSYEKISRIINCAPNKVPLIIYNTRKKLLNKNSLLIFVRQYIHIILTGAVILVFINAGFQIMKNEKAIKYIMNISSQRESISFMLNQTVNLQNNELIKISPGTKKPDDILSSKHILRRNNSINSIPVEVKLNGVNFIKPKRYGFIDAKISPSSSFPLNVKTFSYKLITQFIDSGKIPHKSSVRIEELVNTFLYEYPNPKEKTISLSAEVAKCPWNNDNYLLILGLRTKTAKGNTIVANKSKIKLIFNADLIDGYKLLGYENYRMPKGAIVNNFSQGEDLFSNYTVSALYELKVTDLNLNTVLKDNISSPNPVLTIMFQCEDAKNNNFEKVEKILYANDFTKRPSNDFIFAASVAEFGLLLSDSSSTAASFKKVLESARNSLGKDILGDRTNFLRLLEKTQNLFNSQ